MQGGDVGSQYRSAVYYHTPEQQAAARKVPQNPETLSSRPLHSRGRETLKP